MSSILLNRLRRLDLRDPDILGLVVSLGCALLSAIAAYRFGVRIGGGMLVGLLAAASAAAMAMMLVDWLFDAVLSRLPSRRRLS